MREILFRGKTLNGNEWVIGAGVYKSEGYTWIITDDVTKTANRGTGSDAIIPFTVGQFTGLADKNGKRIFEGDILYSPFWWWGPRFVYLMQGECGACHADSVMQYILASNVENPEHHATYNIWNGCEVEIIGNIHDNPELLENP